MLCPYDNVMFTALYSRQMKTAVTGLLGQLTRGCLHKFYTDNHTKLCRSGSSIANSVPSPTCDVTPSIPL